MRHKHLDNRLECWHRVSTRAISVKYVVHSLLIRDNKGGVIIAKAFQLNKTKGLNSITDAGGSGSLGQNKVREGKVDDI